MTPKMVPVNEAEVTEHPVELYTLTAEDAQVRHQVRVAVTAGWSSWKRVAYSVVQRCTDTHGDEGFPFFPFG